MQKTLFICTILSIVLSAGNCKKSSTPDPGTTASTYQPTTTGSEWSYTTTGTTASGPVNTSFKLTATSKDSVSNGKTFRVFTNTAGANEYYNKSGTDYSRISVFAGLPQPVEVLYLKSNLGAGATWSEVKNVPGFPVPVNLTYTVVKYNFDTSVNGLAFQDVIRIKVKPEISGLPIEENDISYLFAKDIGMIYNKVVLRINMAAMNVNTETILKTFTIK